MLFSGWTSIVRVLIVGVPIYIALLAILNVMGKHALAKSNAYGLVITTGLGSALASTILTKQVTLVDGIVGIGLLLSLQYLLATLVTNFGWASRWFTAKPSLIVWEGQILRDELHKARLTESEVFSAVRQSGYSAIEEMGAVVLESNGSLSVIHKLNGTRSALADVPVSEILSAQLNRGVSSSHNTIP